MSVESAYALVCSTFGERAVADSYKHFSYAGKNSSSSIEYELYKLGEGPSTGSTRNGFHKELQV